MIRIKINLTAQNDDDLLALYTAVGNREFVRIAKDVFLAYSTGLPYYEEFDLQTVNSIHNAEVIIKIYSNKYRRFVEEYSKCLSGRKEAFAKTILKIYLTPSLMAFYQGTDKNAIITAHDLKKEIKKPKKVIKKEETDKPVSASTQPVPTAKEEPIDIAPVMPKGPASQPTEQSEPVLQQKNTKQADTEAMADMMAKMSAMMEQMQKMTSSSQPAPITNAQTVTVPGPEDEPEEQPSGGFDTELASIFGQLSSD